VVARGKINGIGTLLDTHIETTGSSVHGLGTISTQNASAVVLSGSFTGDVDGSISGSSVVTNQALLTHAGLSGSQVHGLGTVSTQNASAIDITGGTISNTNFLHNIATKSASYVMTGLDEIILANDSLTITLPDATSYVGKQCIIKRINSLGNVTVLGTSSQTIDGDVAGIVLTNQYDAVTLISNGSNWFII